MIGCWLSKMGGVQFVEQRLLVDPVDVLRWTMTM